MSRFKNDHGHTAEFPYLGLRVEDGDTFEVPDESDESMIAQGFSPSKTKTPDVTVDPAVAEALTGPIPVSTETVPAPNTTTTN